MVPQPDRDVKPGEAPVQKSLADKIRERWGRPVVTEETRGEDKPRGSRSPRTEDLPSPRCVWEDYRAAAAHYGENALLASAAFWVVSVIPLAWNMIAAANHVASQKPGRFWAFTLTAALIVIVLIVFG